MSVVVQLPPELGVESPRRFALGGMGELFTAEKIFPQGGRTRLVVKHMLPQYTHTEELVSRFRDEARLGLVLRHSNIVRVLEYWEIDGHHYMVMEEIDGFDLAEVIVACRRTKREIPQVVAAYFLHGIASALAYMADATSSDGSNLELVHRDISPSNILVSRDGVIKLIDFGVAKAAEREARTRTGYFVGKYSYMSPEQIHGEAVDIRSDLFALGVVGYQLLAGHSPFQGTSDFETMNLVLTKDPEPLERVRRDVHPMLSLAIGRCMAKELDERYEHPIKLVEDLHRYFYVAVDRPPSLQAREFLGDLGLITHIERDEVDSDATVPLGKPRSSTVQLKVSSAPSEPTLNPARVTASMPTPESETEPGAPSGPSTGAVDHPAPVPEPTPEPTPEPATPATPAAPAAPEQPVAPTPRRSPDPLDRDSVDEEYLEEKRREQRLLMWLIPGGVAALILALVLTAALSGVFKPHGSRGDDPGQATPAVDATPAEQPAVDATDDATDDATPSAGDIEHQRVDDASPAEETTTASATPPPPTAPVRQGTLVVRCIPWANIRVDGRELGRTPATKRLSAGRHKLEASNPDMGWSRTQWVTIEADQTTTINLKSERSADSPPP